LYGLDLHEHGIPAYPEYVISSLGSTVSELKRDVVHAQAVSAIRVTGEV
jgi:hypothetical protein